MENNQPPIPETNDLPPVVPGQEFQTPEFSANIPPVENNSPSVPPSPKTKSKLMPILLIILILVLLGVGGIYAYKNFFVKAPEPTPVPTPEATLDPTADWKTYTSSINKYSIKIPKDWQSDDSKGVFIYLPGDVTFTPLSEMDIEIDSFRTKIAITAMTTENIRYSLNTQQQFEEWYDKTPATDVQKLAKVENTIIDGVRAVKFISTTLPGEATEPFFSIVTWFIKDGKNYYIEFGGDEEKVTNNINIYNQILSTFKFTDISPTPTTTTSINKVKILDTSSWVDYSCNLISYKLPSNYTQQCHVGTDGVQDEIVYREKEGYSGSSIFVKQYDGGSRRQNWIDTMKASDSEVSKYVIFQESLFGNVSGLDVFASGGWWQGGYASPILISHDKTIVSIHGGRDYNEVTKKITRWEISDTIASTIKFNK